MPLFVRKFAEWIKANRAVKLGERVKIKVYCLSVLLLYVTVMTDFLSVDGHAERCGADGRGGAGVEGRADERGGDVACLLQPQAAGQ